MFNTGLPLTALEAAAKSDQLSAELRVRLAAMAWTRAILAGNEVAALALAPLTPELSGYGQAAADERPFAAALLILRNPGLSPALQDGYDRRTGTPLNERSIYRDNWWCDGEHDPRAPEALHRTVYATRYGCPDTHNGEISQSAFQLLHRHWPNSEWAKKTPYWYK
ncbi:MAG: hypothetical protein FJW20_18920 [Acidimicrobiia bacterium]|nr:hypothetical protein [Acidimicrobiia bacterium]